MALGTTLPFWPALLFSYLEPISLVLGWNAAFAQPKDFITQQMPSSSTLTPIPDGAIILSYSTGNVFLLLAALSIVCTFITRETRVTKAFLLSLALGDLGHIYSSYKVMGPEIFWNFNNYNHVMWGNIAASAFLHVNRLATVLGVFGRLR